MIKIIVLSCNNPIFIKLQYDLLNKFLKNDFEMILFNDGKDWADVTNFGDSTMRQQIVEMCIKLGIKCINLENNHHRNISQASIQNTCDEFRRESLLIWFWRSGLPSPPKIRPPISLTTRYVF